MSDRERLPNRRGAEASEFEHAGRRWIATIGYFSDGRVAELFLHSSKVSPLANLAQESAIIASLALQFGCPLDTLRHAISGRSEGPIAAALSLIDGGGK